MGLAQDFASEQLAAFKHRMRISTNDEAENLNLKMMLSASFVEITLLVGVKDASHEGVGELIFERARYVYNDALDEFLGNYEQNIHNLYIANLPDDPPEEAEVVE